jgi:DNA-binding NarL/FixJ family response regulator
MDLLKSEIPSLDSIRQAYNAEEASAMINESLPDIVIADLSLPTKSGREFVEELLDVSGSPKIIVCSMYESSVLIDYLYKKGISAYVAKRFLIEDLVTAINIVSQNAIYYPDPIVKCLDEVEKINSLNSLTGREIEIVKLIANGVESNEIAGKLGITEENYYVILGRIKKKINAKNIKEIVRFAVHNCLVDVRWEH